MRPGKVNLEKAKDMKGTLKKLLAYMGRYKVALMAVLFVAFVSTVLSVMGPKILGQATTYLADGLMEKVKGTGSIDFHKIGMVLSYTLAIYVVSTLLSLGQGFVMTKITQKVCYNLRRDISKKINSLPLGYFESRPYGDVLSRITNDVDTIGTGLNQSITQMITSTTTIIGVLVMMLTISRVMTLIALIVLPVSAGFLALVVKYSQRYFKKQQEALGQINGLVEEAYGGHLVIKSFNMEEEMTEKFKVIGDEMHKSAQRSQFLSGLLQPLMVFVGNLGYGAVVISGGMLAIKGYIGIGDIQAFIQYVKNFTQPLQQMAQVVNQIQGTAAAAERVFEFLGEKDEAVLEGEPLQIAEVKGQVAFDKVNFSYTDGVPIIKNFSLDVKPGQKVAIVGPTGAGKTTIVKLLMEFYPVDSGNITLDGIDCQSMGRSNLRQHFSMVLQDTWLYSGTIMENIRYGRLDATDEEVIEAAKSACAHHFIETLPGGYQMKINEDGTNISQGQKQLITIARAILANRPVLILDEATSSVDTRTEAIIQKAMDNLMKGRTSFVIAHRLSTIRNADVILVMRDGSIVEMGSHQQLIEDDGFYAQLYNSQFDQ